MDSKISADSTFKLHWTSRSVVYFRDINNIRNDKAAEEDIRISRNGQELSSECGRSLLSVLHQSSKSTEEWLRGFNIPDRNREK